MSEDRVYKHIKVVGGRIPSDVEIKVGDFFLSGVKEINFNVTPKLQPNEITVTFYIDKFSFDVGLNESEEVES